MLADGSLITVGHRSIKGVTGLDLTSLFVGSEGVLGIVVKATVRLRPLPGAPQTAHRVFRQHSRGRPGPLGHHPVTRRPAAIEFLDTPSLENIDEHSGTALRGRGAALILIEIDGYGINEQAADLTAALTAAAPGSLWRQTQPAPGSGSSDATDAASRSTNGSSARTSPCPIAAAQGL